MPMQPVRILLVEDSPGFARLIQEMLAEADRGKASLERVPRLSEALERLRQGGVDLVLLDLGLPDSQGLNTFIQAQTKFPEIPFVILTGLDNEELALTAVRQGAQDYLVKDETDTAALLRSIRYAAERKKAQEALRRAYDQLEQRVKERTAELEQANRQLHEEIKRRTETEAALQASENRYRAIFENTGTATIIVDTEGRICLANTEFENLAGCPREELQGKKSIDEFVVPGDREKVRHYRQMRFRQPSLAPRNYEFRWQGRPQEKPKDILVTASLIPGTQLTVGSLLDITDRKQADKALRLAHDNLELKVAMRTAELAKANAELQQEVEERKRAETATEAERQRLFTLLDGLPAFVYVKSPDYYVHFANRQFQEMFGAPRGKHCYEVIHGLQEPCPSCPQDEVLKTHTPNRLDWTSTALNRTFQVHNYPFADSDGSSRVLTLGIDITDRKRAEGALRESLELFRAIFEGASIGIGLADLRGRLLTTNRAFKEMLGYRTEEIFAKTFTEFTHPEDLPKSMELFQELTAGKRDRYQIEKRFIRKEGDAIWVRVAFSLAKGLTGEPLYAIGMVENITKRKQAEARLRESEQNLRYLAAQLLTAQERERQRIAMDLHDDLGQSLMVLKMQLRTIEREMAPELALLREQIAEQAVYVDAIVDSVRRLSRDLRPTILEDLGLTAALKRLFEDFSKHHHLELSVQLEDVGNLIPPEAHINIYRVFQESLTNIAKYAQATRVAITVEKNQGSVAFAIQDDGKGFDLDRVRSGDPARRGLGLAAMEERIHMLKGSFAIQSNEGQGTRICFTIPTTGNDSRPASSSLSHP